MQRFERLADFYTTGTFAPYVQEYASAGDSPTHLIKARQPEGDFSDPPSGDIVLIKINNNVRGVETDFGAGRSSRSARVNDFYLVPPETATDIYVHNPHEISIIGLPFASIQQALADHVPDFNGDFGKLHTGHFRNNKVLKYVHQLWSEAKGGNTFGSLFADNIAQLIVCELLRQSDRLDNSIDEIRPLESTKVDLIDEFLESDLGTDAGLAELATLTGYSTFHFSRAFKAAKGSTPHQYLKERRLNRARELLNSTTLGLAEIAYACGFSSQAHMTSTFSNHLGISPGKFRKERMS